MTVQSASNTANHFLYIQYTVWQGPCPHLSKIQYVLVIYLSKCVVKLYFIVFQFPPVPCFLSFPPHTLPLSLSAYSGDWLCSGTVQWELNIQHHHHICDSGSGASFLPPSLPPSLPSPILSLLLSDLSLFAWMLLLKHFADLKRPFMYIVYITHHEGMFPRQSVPYLLSLWCKVI